MSGSPGAWKNTPVNSGLSRAKWGRSSYIKFFELKTFYLDGQVVHLSVFDRPKNEEETRRFFRMGSFSNQRGNRG